MQLRSGLQAPTELELEDGFQTSAKPTALQAGSSVAKGCLLWQVRRTWKATEGSSPGTAGWY